MKRAKKSQPRAKRQNITIPMDLYEESMSFVRKYHFEGISDLIHHLMRLMLENGSPHFAIHSAPPFQSSSAFKIEAFKKLQQQLQLTPEKAAAWMADVKNARR